MRRRELVELKIAMEFGAAPDGDRLPLAQRNVEGQPRLLVSRSGDAYAVYFRFDLPESVRNALSLLEPAILMHDEERVRSILATDAPSEKVYRLRWYTFDRVPDPAEYPDVILQDDRYVIIVEGEPAAWARTDSEIERAAEVSIETREAFRRRGYARQVTAAWAAAVLAQGKVAFYSHVLDNVGSQAVAESIGVTHLSDEVEYL